MAVPTRCLVDRPNPHSVKFAGTHINLTQLAMAVDLNYTHISRVFNGLRRLPRIEHLRQMAEALGMDLEDFVIALEDRAEQETERRLQHRQDVDLFRAGVDPRYPLKATSYS